MTLQELKLLWVDEPAYHKHINDIFTELVNNTSGLNEHRTYVETKIYGMGERSFWWLWKLILEILPDNPKLLETGVFKAATMSLWKLLRIDANCYGVTPLDGRGTGWINEDYYAHIQKIHQDFGLQMPTLFVGGSEEPKMVVAAGEQKYDVVYIDGDHSYNGALSDLSNYAPMVNHGGYLVIDDSNCEMHMPWGFFQGIQEVTDAKVEWIKNNGNDWEFIFSVVHISVFKKIK